jgi:hypothetical protein
MKRTAREFQDPLWTGAATGPFGPEVYLSVRVDWTAK